MRTKNPILRLVAGVIAAIILLSAGYAGGFWSRQGFVQAQSDTLAEQRTTITLLTIIRDGLTERTEDQSSTIQAQAAVIEDQDAALTERDAKIEDLAARLKAKEAAGWHSGVASTYGIGDGLLGNCMANGKPLTMDGLTVAHKTLPKGTRVQIRYNGKTVTATVTDRGPYVAGRTWDLGPGVSRALGFAGVHSVQYRILGK